LDAVRLTALQTVEGRDFSHIVFHWAVRSQAVHYPWESCCGMLKLEISVLLKKLVVGEISHFSSFDFMATGGLRALERELVLRQTGCQVANHAVLTIVMEAFELNPVVLAYNNILANLAS